MSQASGISRIGAGRLPAVPRRTQPARRDTNCTNWHESVIIRRVGVSRAAAMEHCGDAATGASYQIFARDSGSRHMAAPGLIPNAA